MVRFNNPLDDVKVAAPCPANWDEMIGCEQVRFCSQCSLNVYNLSGMSKTEAESIIARTEGRLCVRFYRRADGTILTNNCPIGLRAIRRRLSRIKTAIISAALSFFAGLGIFAGLSEKDDRVYPGTTGVLVIDANPPGAPAPEIMGEVEVGVMGRPSVNSSRFIRRSQQTRRNVQR